MNLSLRRSEALAIPPTNYGVVKSQAIDDGTIRMYALVWPSHELVASGVAIDAILDKCVQTMSKSACADLMNFMYFTQMVSVHAFVYYRIASVPHQHFA